MACAAWPAGAQTTAGGTIHGVATDPQRAAVPGVFVSATSPTVPGVRSATTDREGQYRLIDLPPGEYVITAELAGFSRFVRTPVLVRAGLNLEVDIVLTLGSIDEAVEVRQETPLLETQHAGQAVNISGELLRAIPLLERREWFGALTVVPGVTSSEWVNNERIFFVHGADSNANIVQIDGADMTSAAVAGVRYVSLNNDAIADVQIKTSGVDASAPLGLGGIINIATASGTNRVTGSGTVVVQPRAWNDSNIEGGTSSTVDQTQADVSVGAPIVKNRLWAYAAYRYVHGETGVSRTPAQLDALRALLPGYVPFDSLNEAHFWFAKVSAQPSARHQVTAFYQYDVNPSTIVDPIGVRATEEATGGSGASLRLASSWSNRFTTRLGASYNDKRRDVHPPSEDGPIHRVFHSTIVSGGRPVGNGQLANIGSPFTAWTRRPNSKVTLSLDATIYVTEALGSHQLQAGVYAQPRIRISLENYYVNNGLVTQNSVLRVPGVLDSGIVPFHRVMIEDGSLVSSRLEGEDYAFYVQDAWRPTSRLTINAGVRIDRVSWRDRLFNVTSQRSTSIGPRLGVNYALTDDSRTIARAHWVRVHDQPATMAPSVGNVAVGQRDLYDVNLDGTFETVFVTPATFALTSGRTLDPDLHQPFVREWGTGFTRQLGGSIAVGVDVLRREFRDRPGLVETNGRYEGNVFRGYIDEAFNESYRVTNNTWNWPVYTSLELSATKRTATLQGIVSYVRQWRHMGGTWQPHDPASFIQPAAFANVRGIGSPTGTTAAPTDANSLSGTHMTQRSTASAQWQDHAVRLGVTCSGPWALLIASHYTFQSGAWSGPIVTRIAAADPAFGPTTVTLSNGRVVTNPLATVIRFARSDRGEGQLTTPDLHSWNLRVGRRFSWGRVTWDGGLDLFNVTNNGADLSFQSGGNQTYSPLYGVTMFRQLPRSAQISLRTTF
jgi:Carboxypeptidase regulatory-like domain/TonB dependent receptor